MLTWSVLVVLAIILTVISLWRMNVLFSVTAFGAWMAAIAYHVIDRPTGIIAGEPPDVAILLVFAGVSLTILVLAMGRSGKRTGSRYTSVEGDDLSSPDSSDSIEEYRERTRTALRRKKRS